ncbi:DUF4279 domain-containing protein [Xanthomonas massiliensis]|uniref:DUF4279 domain-containing protein n=1 Tax=Xanthomonas massiliensis TaxID=1720302 RepID=UPI00098F6D18
MSCLETNATLRVFSESLHPEEVSSIWGLSATRPRPKEPDSKYRPRRECHYWSWSSDSQVHSQDGLEHIRAITAILRDKGGQLEQLREAGCDIDVCCYWVSSGKWGPSLEVSDLNSLSALGLAIWWDVYFGDPEEYKEGAAAASGGGA